MKIVTPIITNFNKDMLAPSNEKLASFTVGQLPKNIKALILYYIILITKPIGMK